MMLTGIEKKTEMHEIIATRAHYAGFFHKTITQENIEEMTDQEKKEDRLDTPTTKFS